MNEDDIDKASTNADEATGPQAQNAAAERTDEAPRSDSSAPANTPGESAAQDWHYQPLTTNPSQPTTPAEPTNPYTQPWPSGAASSSNAGFTGYNPATAGGNPDVPTNGSPMNPTNPTNPSYSTPAAYGGPVNPTSTAYGNPTVPPYTNAYPVGQAGYPAVQPVAYAYAPASNERWNVLCVVGFVLAFFIPVAGLAVSVVALVQINRTHERSRGMSIAGIIISALRLVFEIILILIFVVVFGLLSDHPFNYSYTNDNCDTYGNCTDDPNSHSDGNDGDDNGDNNDNDNNDGGDNNDGDNGDDNNNDDTDWDATMSSFGVNVSSVSDIIYYTVPLAPTA